MTDTYLFTEKNLFTVKFVDNVNWFTIQNTLKILNDNELQVLKKSLTLFKGIIRKSF